MNLIVLVRSDLRFDTGELSWVMPIPSNDEADLLRGTRFATIVQKERNTLIVIARNGCQRLFDIPSDVARTWLFDRGVQEASGPLCHVDLGQRLGDVYDGPNRAAVIEWIRRTAPNRRIGEAWQP